MYFPMDLNDSTYKSCFIGQIEIIGNALSYIVQIKIIGYAQSEVEFTAKDMPKILRINEEISHFVLTAIKVKT